MNSVFSSDQSDPEESYLQEKLNKYTSVSIPVIMNLASFTRTAGAGVGCGRNHKRQKEISS